jgi:protein SCO1/2
MNIRAPLAAAALLLGGCGAAPPPEQPPLAGARIGGAFALTDQDGRPRTDRDFAGKWRVMYFGYTFCPDVCPTDVQNIGAGLRRFEADDATRAATVVPVFVTIDPVRDTPAAIKPFVTAFHPRMVGLTGTPEAIAALAKSYAAYFTKGADAPGGGYLMDHSRQAYLMDPQGAPVALIPQDKGPEAVAAELARWVR